jgi:hypothetical protein
LQLDLWQADSLMKVVISGVSVWGPGLPGWDAAQSVFSGRNEYSATQVPLPPCTLLPANERRRAGLATRLALFVAQQASEMARVVPGSIPSVFATSNGDGVVVNTILEAIAADQPVSPTQFHNSVHNAAAGYWSIATGSQQPTTCIAGHDATASGALLKAVAEVQAESKPLLLCVYDVPLPPPLDTKHPTHGSFGASLVLAPEATQPGMAAIAVRYAATTRTATDALPRSPALHRLAAGNPAARLLRLLETLACAVPDEFSMALLNGGVKVRVQPCSPADSSSN